MVEPKEPLAQRPEVAPHDVAAVALSRRAPPVGRALRAVLGLLLIANVVPIYFRGAAQLVVVSILLVLGLIGAYTVALALISRRIFTPHPAVGAIAALALVVALYVAGAPGGPVFGDGEGELAVITFLGVSLIIAGFRGDPGCEVMSIPAAVVGKRAELACLVFSPLDRLERKLREKRAV